MLLILGGSGFLGPALHNAKGAEELVYTHFAHAVPGSHMFDVRHSSVADLLREIGGRPSGALILAGVTNIDACARDPAGTGKINVDGIVRVIEQLRALEITPVFTSSDAVFDGTHASWREEESVHPILTYGHQKLAVESYLSRLPPPWLAVRLPKLVSTVRNPRCMITGWVEALGRDEPIRCATDQYFTPADARDVAEAILKLVHAGATGLHHLGGPERLSRRELLAEVVDEYRKYSIPKAHIVECSLRDIRVLEPRPLDVSMDSTRYTSRFGNTIRPASAIARLAVRDCFGSMEASGA